MDHARARRRREARERLQEARAHGAPVVKRSAVRIEPMDYGGQYVPPSVSMLRKAQKDIDADEARAALRAIDRARTARSRDAASGAVWLLLLVTVLSICIYAGERLLGPVYGTSIGALVGSALVVAWMFLARWWKR